MPEAAENTRAAATAVDRYLGSLEIGVRRLAPGEWGLCLPPGVAGCRELEMSVRIEDGLLAIRAFAAAASEQLPAPLLLHLNRQTRLARIGCSLSGEVWVHAEIPVDQLQTSTLDRLLGHVVEAAAAIRELSRARTEGVERWPSPWTDGPQKRWD